MLTVVWKIIQALKRDRYSDRNKIQVVEIYGYFRNHLTLNFDSNVEQARIAVLVFGSGQHAVRDDSQSKSLLKKTTGNRIQSLTEMP